MDLLRFSYWVMNRWTVESVCECFNAKDDYERMYWEKKYDENIIKFFMSLDEMNKLRFERYVNRKLLEYKGKAE